MRKIFYLLIIIASPFIAIAQNQVTKDYVQQYKGIAIREMKRTGIPASITLAQAVLESASGESNLSKKFNNHFGIKCKTEWKGPTTYQDDDTKNECFRVYPNADSSFIDHSNFLKYRPYYANLFELDPVDDTAWAYGLKKAGYATERDYPNKLLKIIDDYELAQYNYPELVAEDSIEAINTSAAFAEKKNPVTKADTAVIKMDTTASITDKTKKLAQLTETTSPSTITTTAPAPISLSNVKGIENTTVTNAPIPVMKGLGVQPKDTVIAKETAKVIDSSKTIAAPIVTQKTTEAPATKTKPNYPVNQKFRINQTPAIWAEKGRSVLEIATTYKIPLYKIYEYNEMPETDLIVEDQIVYLAERKKETSKKEDAPKTITAPISNSIPNKTTDSIKTKPTPNKIDNFIKLPFLKSKH